MIYQVNGFFYRSEDIRDARIKKEISIVKFAKKIGVSPDTISNIERGYRTTMTGSKTLPAVVKALDVQPCEMIRVSDCAKIARVTAVTVRRWQSLHDDFPEVVRVGDNNVSYVDGKEFRKWFNSYKKSDAFKMAKARADSRRKNKAEAKRLARAKASAIKPEPSAKTKGFLPGFDTIRRWIGIN